MILGEIWGKHPFPAFSRMEKNLPLRVLVCYFSSKEIETRRRRGGGVRHLNQIERCVRLTCCAKSFVNSMMTRDFKIGFSQSFWKSKIDSHSDLPTDRKSSILKCLPESLKTNFAYFITKSVTASRLLVDFDLQD